MCEGAADVAGGTGLAVTGSDLVWVVLAALALLTIGLALGRIAAKRP